MTSVLLLPRETVRKWLNLGRVAEISQCEACNFSFSLEFK
jgi:hypothetical protein